MILREQDFENKEKTFIDEYYKPQYSIILHNVGRPKYDFIDGDKDYKVCRFCGKTQDETTFNNKAHIVPKFLGNFLDVSNFECDECNVEFSKYETELEKYIKLPLIVNLKNTDLKNRLGKNISRIDGEIDVRGEKEMVSFNGHSIQKIFLKFAYSLIKDEELNEYKDVREVLLSDKVYDITNILDITYREPFQFNSVTFFNYKKTDGKMVDNILMIDFNMKRYVIFINKDNSRNKYNVDEQDEYIKLFNDRDIYNCRFRNLDKEEIKIKFDISQFVKLINN